MPGRGRSKQWWAIYHAMVKKGTPKQVAAKVASAKISKNKKGRK